MLEKEKENKEHLTKIASAIKDAVVIYMPDAFKTSGNSKKGRNTRPRGSRRRRYKKSKNDDEEEDEIEESSDGEGVEPRKEQMLKAELKALGLKNLPTYKGLRAALEKAGVRDIIAPNEAVASLGDRLIRAAELIAQEKIDGRGEKNTKIEIPIGASKAIAMVGTIGKMMGRSSLVRLHALILATRKAGVGNNEIDYRTGIRKSIGTWGEDTPVDVMDFANFYSLEVQASLDEVFKQVLKALHKAALAIRWDTIKASAAREDPELQKWVETHSKNGAWQKGATAISVAKQMVLYHQHGKKVGDDGYEALSEGFDKSMSDAVPFGLIQRKFSEGIWLFLPSSFQLSR